MGAAAGTPAVTASISFSDPRLTRLVPRWAFLVLLLAAELVVLTLPFDASKVLQDRSGIVGLFVGLLAILRPVFITGAAAIVFLSWDVARDEFIRVFHDPDDPAHTSFNWLGVHFIVLVPLIIGTIARRNGYLADPAHPVRWLSAWMILGSGRGCDLGRGCHTWAVLDAMVPSEPPRVCDRRGLWRGCDGARRVHAAVVGAAAEIDLLGCLNSALDSRPPRGFVPAGGHHPYSDLCGAGWRSLFGSGRNRIDLRVSHALPLVFSA